MTDAPALRRGWTTGTCATAATKAALTGLWTGTVPGRVSVTLPKGEMPEFEVVGGRCSADCAEAGIIKDAGDDPDVTHGAEIRVSLRAHPGGVTFRAGPGVGRVTKPGLPIAVGEPAINPVPRKMMEEEVVALAIAHDRAPDIEITVSVVNGAALALKTWNPRLGIEGGLSILGTTGIVRPFSCAAWIASIHRGIDVARASGLTHVAGCTGATSERVVQALHGLPDHAMLDMGDFAGGLLKYLRRHPVPRLTIGGGIGKMSKLAAGAMDLHSGRSQVDFARLSEWAGQDLTGCNTALEAHGRAGPKLALSVAERAKDHIANVLQDTDIVIDTVIIDRAGTIIGRSA
jgi:cobalt-precorrin-5B (C1)-methyltransferase